MPTMIVESLKDNNFSSIDEDSIIILRDHGIIVDEDANELSAYEYYYNCMQYGNIEEELRLVILPTYQCNLRCVYCFEHTQDYNYKLDADNIDSILSFTFNELKDKNYKTLRLLLFGGEPLLCKDACISLTQKLSDLASRNNLGFICQIVTNSILVDEQLIQTLIKPFNMKMQITIDGEKQTHDQRRVYKSGKGTFDEIRSRLVLLNNFGCKHLIDLRLNIDRNNLDNVDSVVKDFSKLCNYLYVGLLRPVGNNSCRKDDCITDIEYLTSIRPHLFKLLEKLQNRNASYVSFGKKKPCALNRHANYIIDPLLDVYKCDNLVGNKKYSVGSIINGELKKNSEYYKQSTWSPFHFEQCRKCMLLPVCCSDCAYRCLLHEGTMDRPHCALTEEDLVKQIIVHLENTM